MSREANRIYATGGFADVLAFRLREIPLIIPLHVYVFARTIGLFLLGAFAWRTGLLRNAPGNRSLLFAIAAAGIGLGAALILANAGGIFTGGMAAFWQVRSAPSCWRWAMAPPSSPSANLARGKAWLGWAAPLGRMAFTNYLAQSVIFGWIFYGYGLGLFGHLGTASALAIGIAVYVAQVLFSAWWLRRFRYGPVEWLWRTLMYGAAQPMSDFRRGPLAAYAASAFISL